MGILVTVIISISVLINYTKPSFKGNLKGFRKKVED